MYKLTNRESQLIPLIQKGLTNKEIAQELDVKTTTIGAYIYKLSRIYQAKNRIDLVNKISGENYE